MTRRPALADAVLAVDAGNSKLAAVLYLAGRERARWRIDGASPAPRRAATAIARAVRDLAPGVPAIMASVAPRRSAPLVEALRRAGSPVRVLRPHDPWPFTITVRRPKSIGVDRLANVAGLVALGMRSGIAIDAGTAITIDLLAAGVFAGGFIVPGPALALRALHAHTAALPLLEPQDGPPLALGRDTEEAMRGGVAQVLGRGAAATAVMLQRAAGSRAPIVLTGGAAAALQHSFPPTARLEPDLQLLGLRLMAANRSPRGRRNRS